MEVLMFILYGISVLCMIASLWSIFVDLMRYAKDLKASGVKFRKPSKLSSFINLIKLLFCIFCPVVNTLLFIAILIAEDSVTVGAIHNIDDNILNGEE